MCDHKPLQVAAWREKREDEESARVAALKHAQAERDAAATHAA